MAQLHAQGHPLAALEEPLGPNKRRKQTKKEKQNTETLKALDAASKGDGELELLAQSQSARDTAFTSGKQTQHFKSKKSALQTDTLTTEETKDKLSIESKSNSFFKPPEPKGRRGKAAKPAKPVEKKQGGRGRSATDKKAKGKDALDTNRKPEISLLQQKSKSDAASQQTSTAQGAPAKMAKVDEVSARLETEYAPSDRRLELVQEVKQPVLPLSQQVTCKAELIRPEEEAI